MTKTKEALDEFDAMIKAVHDSGKNFLSVQTIETIRNALKAQEWQPIETAPRDEREVIVYVAGAHGLPSFVTTCCYHEDAGWCADELREVTHWMPLPQPPKKGE